MSFVDNLRVAMERAGVSQSELARRLGIRSQAVNQWFKPGGTAPRGKRLAQIAAALGVGLSELLGEAAVPGSDYKETLLAVVDALSERDRETLLRVAQSMRHGDSEPPPLSSSDKPLAFHSGSRPGGH